MTASSDRHDHAAQDGPLESNPIWQQDNVTLRSVGIDIGSSGTQVVFSRLHLRRLGENLTSRYVVVGRETLFETPVHLTPYLDAERIDGSALGQLLDLAYQDARQRPEDIDTGAVILTGEALRRVNAEHIAAVVSQRAGDLVCAAAGHHMEAMLAAYGSGAVLESHQRSQRILNIDIGGGTTKLAVVDRGRVEATAALHVGGRLQVIGSDARLVRLEPAGREHAVGCGFSWSVGNVVEDWELDTVAQAMADAIVAAVNPGPLTERVRALFLTAGIPDYGSLDGVTFSGGVAEYVYGREARDFGDLGRRLGAALRGRVARGDLPAPMLPCAAGIRATVLGASQYTVQLSGNTSDIGDADALLPVRNLPVIRPGYELGSVVDADDVCRALRGHLTSFDLAESDENVAVALRWDGSPDYPRLRAFAEGVMRGLEPRLRRRLPVYLMVDADIAMSLGTLLRQECGVTGAMLVLDGVALHDFDYVDLGRVRRPSNTVPVTVKSLVFSPDSEAVVPAEA